MSLPGEQSQGHPTIDRSEETGIEREMEREREGGVRGWGAGKYA